MDKKPPIGLIPYPIWLMNCLEERMKDINNAMRRYYEVNKPIPNSWTYEYLQLKEQYEQAQKLPLGIEWNK